MDVPGAVPTVLGVKRLLLALWLLLAALLPPGAHAGEPEWHKAPEPMVERPVVPAPVGGWWVEDGQYARVYSLSADRVTARRLADHAAVSVPRLAERLGVPAGETMEIYLAPTRDLFGTIQPGTPPDWADGTAWAALGLVFLHAPEARDGTAEPLEQVLDHEIVHVLLGRAFLPRVVPRWLQEGLAQFYAGELDARVATTLSVAAGKDELLPMAQITRGFPKDPTRAHIAYAQSADFIGWLASHHGEPAIRTLIQQLALGHDYEDAIQEATGLSAKTVEGKWRDGWNDPFFKIAALVNTNVLWGIGGVLLLAGAVRRRQKTKEKLARWEAEEAAAQERIRARRWVHAEPREH